MSNRMKGKILFQEEQRFTNTWMWYLLLSISGLIVLGIILRIIFDPIPEGITGLIISLLVLGTAIGVFTSSKLVVTIDQYAIHYRFHPFVNSEKSLGQAAIKELYLRTYRPMREYGGYGYRYSLKSGRALSMQG